MHKKRLRKPIKVILFLIITLLVILSIYYLSINILNSDTKKKTFTQGEKKTTTTAEVKKEEVNSAKLTIVGDLLFEQPFYDSLEKDKNNTRYFSLVKDDFLNDDLSIGNMEVVIGNKNLTSSGTGYNFCAPESIGNLVASLDFEVLSTANNHSYDRARDGINSTIDFFKNNTDIMTIGTAKKKEDLNRNNILTINDIKFGFVAYTLGTNITVPEKNRDFISLYRDPTTKKITEEYKIKMKNDIDNLKNQVDVIISVVHWGKEFTYAPNSEQKELAEYLNSLGVDIIVGSHSHSIQPIEWINGKNKKTLVYYSMGNFVSADNDISRTGEEFDNAYQVGLMSKLIVKKDNENITIENITTEPIVNYYDKDMRNFLLIPFSKYSDDYEKTHYRYNNNFNKNFIKKMYENVINKEFR